MTHEMGAGVVCAARDANSSGAGTADWQPTDAAGIIVCTNLGQS